MKQRFRTWATLFAVIASISLRVAAAEDAAPKDRYDRSGIPIEVQPADAKAAKIVLIAGDAGTGHPPGDHEHFAGCALFYRMLQQTPGVAAVFVKDGWPANPETLKNARTLVFYMDGGGKQTTLADSPEIQKMMDAGVGIVHVHQAIDYPTESGKQAMQWLGGVYEPKTGARGHWDEAFNEFPDHEICRGVTPFKLNDGWILKLRFVPELKGITPLMRTTQLSPKKPDKPITGSDNIVCWAYERADGGRAFVLTGGHGHNNWGLPGLRRLTINGILWSAKVEVPKSGAPVELNPADLMTNLERKPEKPAKKVDSKPKTAGKVQKTDAEGLEGIWDIVSGTFGGKPLPPDAIAHAVEIEGEHAWHLTAETRTRATVVKLDRSQAPAHIDFVPDNDPERAVSRGIYELKGDRLKICAGNDRPKSFDADDATVLILQRRPKAAPKTAAELAEIARLVKADTDSLRGIWDIVAIEEDGKPAPKEVSSFALEFGENLAWHLLDKARSRPASVKLDPSHKPARIDITPTEAPDRGNTLHGIYELKGDQLKICIPRDSGGARPKDFTSAGYELLMLKRRAKFDH